LCSVRCIVKNVTCSTFGRGHLIWNCYFHVGEIQPFALSFIGSIVRFKSFWHTYITLWGLENRLQDSSWCDKISLVPIALDNGHSSKASLCHA
jgi:hypothetical protein